jgi:hypothetical protein
MRTAEEDGRCSPQVKGRRRRLTSAAIDDGNLGSAQRMHPKEARVQPDAGDPMGDQPGVLLRRYRRISAARAAKEEFARAFIGGCDIIFDRLSRMETHPSLRVEHEIWRAVMNAARQTYRAGTYLAAAFAVRWS